MLHVLGGPGPPLTSPHHVCGAAHTHHHWQPSPASPNSLPLSSQINTRMSRASIKVNPPLMMSRLQRRGDRRRLFHFPQY